MTQSGAHLDPSEGIRSDGEYPVTEQTGSDRDIHY